MMRTVLVAGAVAAVFHAIAWWVGENLINGGEVVGVLVLHPVVGVLSFLGALVALERRGRGGVRDALVLLGVWAIEVPLLVAALAAVTMLVTPTPTGLEDYPAVNMHHVVQSAVRTELGVAAGLVLLIRVGVRERLRRVAAEMAAKRAGGD